jgi:peptidoglycan/xylan/chitin deacetylase (PgdA/CDA1 family)
MRSKADVSRAALHTARSAKDRLLRLPGTRAFPPRRLKDLRPRGTGGRDAAIALTFDDGPDPDVTPSILATLSDRGVQATFFMCGLSAERHPDVVRSVASEGHIIGGHTWHHLDVRTFSELEWRTEIDRTHDLLESLSRREVRYFRPPWMAIDKVGVERLRQRQLTPVFASASGADWLTDDPGAIERKVAGELHRGAIVLLHDACGDLLPPGAQLPAGAVVSRAATAAALPMILDAARDAGLGCVALPA